ncbi:MAG: response regulator transcription factor [Actinomycetota bacterium]|nr:response regulator transcription factor [Actinomycetota bacterium]
MPAPVALLVEDSREYAAIGTSLLQREGFEVVATPDGEAGIGLARARRPEVILLDISLPGLDGFEVCRRIREFSDAYVIMVTGRTDEVDRVVGLTVGADDYVTKPFSARELTARIAAMRRRPRATPDPEVWDFGPLRVDVAAREAVLAGELVDLTKLEFDLLAKLASEPRRAFTRAQLLNAVWGSDWYGDDHVVDVHMGNLRKKLGESGTQPRFVHTVRGVGFRFEPES